MSIGLISTRHVQQELNGVIGIATDDLTAPLKNRKKSWNNYDVVHIYMDNAWNKV